MPISDVVTKNISSCSINSPIGGTSSVKASHWCNVKDSLSDLRSPDPHRLIENRAQSKKVNRWDSNPH